MRLQQEILADLHTLERVREMLDIVHIVLGFLSSGGGSADKPLGEYVERVLKMRSRNFSEKVDTSIVNNADVCHRIPINSFCVINYFPVIAILKPKIGWQVFV